MEAEKSFNEMLSSSSSSASSSTAGQRVMRTPSPLNLPSPYTPALSSSLPFPLPTSASTSSVPLVQPFIQTFTSTLQRKKGRLQRSERLQLSESASNTSSSSNSTTTPQTAAATLSAWESLVKESFGQMVWPIKITSWELVDHKINSVRNSSSATELISRRGVFSRQHYGSVDQLSQSQLDTADPTYKHFRVENGESLAERDEVFGSPSAPILENPEHQTRWYFKYFLGKLHQNYVGMEAEKSPYFLSVVSQDTGQQGTPIYRAILFRKQGTQKIALPYQTSQKLNVKQILTHFSCIDVTNMKNPKEIYAADIQKDLLLLEEQEGSVNFKFGVIYMKPGQCCDDDMLSNEESSQDFADFLDILGERIRLKGWDRFRGGLDVKGDMTGKYSIYTLYEGHEIMFHVSTLLPFSRDNRQQVERKRHIGNDIVNIIFIDQCSMLGDDILPTMFDPTWIKSQFTHIFAVVTKTGQTYRLAVYCDENVPSFGPTLPDPPEFYDVNMFRNFLIVKLINGEKAAFQTPIFRQKRERTLEMLIKDLYEDYATDSKLNMLNRRAFSEVLYDVPKTSKLKEDARQIEFVRIGQALKLEAIVKGDAPTSIASASPCMIFKKPPWEPSCFYPTFPYRGLLIGDSYSTTDEHLFIATDDGTFLMKEDQSLQLIFDKSLHVKQLSVLEEHGLMLMRAGFIHNRESYRIHVFRLREFHTKHADEVLKARSRSQVKDRRMERTKGCHLYATWRAAGGYLRLVVAVARKLLLFQWKHTAAWASWCPENDTETIEGFIYQKDILLNDMATIITPLEGNTNTNNNELLCVGYRFHYDIVSIQTGVANRLYEIDVAKRNQIRLTAAIELCDGLETELLLCYNHTCHFQKLNETDEKHSEFDFHWNTSPNAVVCAFPYILGFTRDTLEIRLLVNGNLVHMATLPELHMISCKRDIFYVTTAPEFIGKDINLKGIQLQEQSADKRLVATPSDCSSNEELFQETNNNNNADTNNVDNKMGNFKQVPYSIQEHEVNNLLEIPAMRGQKSLIQKAHSLHKTLRVEDKPPIVRAKSDTFNSNKNLVNTKETQIDVPPNTPRTLINTEAPCKQQSPLSPTKLSSIYRHLFTSNNFNINLTNNQGNAHESQESPDRLKPLRVYRIPLNKLTGAHSHFNMHSFSEASTTAKMNREILTNSKRHASLQESMNSLNHGSADKPKE